MTAPESDWQDHRAASASLEFLTGRARGTVAWLTGSTLDISLDQDNSLRIVEASGEASAAGVIARLHRAGETYEIEAHNQQPLWINGRQIALKQLETRDLIEFGDNGPLARYRMHHQGDPLRRSLGDMLADYIDYTRVSRKPRLFRLRKVTGDLLYDFTLRTTLVFRVGVIVALALLSFIAYQQYRSSQLLMEQAESSAGRLEDFAASLTRTSEEALRPADLNQLRRELRTTLSDTALRVQQLEQRSEAASRVIASATRSVVLLQGSYSFRDTATQRMLRYRVDDEGRPLFSLRGRPLLTLEGEGEVATREFTGTAFIVSASGALLTNRHVALPWEDDNGLEELREQGLEPELIRFIGYVPGNAKAFPLKLLEASETTDLALLVCGEVTEELPYLRLSRRIPEPGDEVIVMGYPTGLRSLLVQTGDDFLASLEQDDGLDFWQVAARLAQENFIRPLASRGIVGQRSVATVVYDAETTHGGSGGPVLDLDGDAIAVNTAIIPEYGGSNFGIPVEFARRLLESAGIDVDAGQSTSN